MNKRDEKLYQAGQWWLRLQEDQSAAAVGEWLAWAQSDPANLDAFDRVEATALDFKRLDSGQREVLAKEFSPSGKKPKYLAVAAGMAVVAAGALLYMAAPFSSDTVYSTERALHENVTLADGSRVTVGAHSSLAVHMLTNERRIRLRDGEAYFEVQKDPHRPFVVNAGNVTVTAIGTAFNVRKTGENIAVSVTEGRVRVMQRGNMLEASAGERILYDPQQRRFNLSAISPQRAVAWRERRLEFVNEPLSTVIGNLNRYVSPQIVIDDSATAQLTFTGTVSPDDLASWLGALPQVLPVRISRERDEIRIYFQTQAPARLVQ